MLCNEWLNFIWNILRLLLGFAIMSWGTIADLCEYKFVCLKSFLNLFIYSITLTVVNKYMRSNSSLYMAMKLLCGSINIVNILSVLQCSINYELHWLLLVFSVLVLVFLFVFSVGLTYFLAHFLLYFYYFREFISDFCGA